VEDSQNVTLALPRALLKRAKRLAAERDTSVSALMADALAAAVEDLERYEAGRRRHLAALRSPKDLGTGGRLRWTRDSLHER
jgi:hypothetical protein